MKVEVNGVQITLSAEQLEQIRKQTEKPKHWWDEWMPIGEHTCFNLRIGVSENHIEDWDFVGDDEINRPIYFHTRKQAELMAKKVQLMIEMHNFASLRNDGWVADWFNDKIKFGIKVLHSGGFIDCYSLQNTFAFGIAVKSKKIAEEMLSIFGDRINEVYNTQY